MQGTEEGSLLRKSSTDQFRLYTIAGSAVVFAATILASQENYDGNMR